jgi:hypothetical protein
MSKGGKMAKYTVKKSMETYTEQKKRHSDDVNKFEGLFFAFSNEQFKEGLLNF